MKEFLRDLLGFLSERKKYWFMPFILMFVMLAALIAVAQYSAAAPFIYTLF
jgi:Family of unknown function (DUF5989)